MAEIAGNEELPDFRYHPDPVGTESIQPSNDHCRCCERLRGFIYVGPVYADDNLEDTLCPWYIADGSAHQQYDAAFTDAAGVGLGWEPVPTRVVEEVSFRTPGVRGLATGTLGHALRRRVRLSRPGRRHRPCREVGRGGAGHPDGYEDE